MGSANERRSYIANERLRYTLSSSPIDWAHIRNNPCECNVLAPLHWPLGGEFTGHRWIPHTKARNAENVSIWWRHYGVHYDDVIMTMLASQITSLTVVYSIVYSGVIQRKHQSSASLAFVREIHRGPVNFPHKWPVTRKMFPFDDVIMCSVLAMLHPVTVHETVFWGVRCSDVECPYLVSLLMLLVMPYFTMEITSVTDMCMPTANPFELQI